MVTQRIYCNCGVAQPPTPHTNTNSFDPLQCNSNVSSKVQEFVPSTSSEALEATSGDGSLQNIHKSTTKTFLLSKYFSKPSKHVAVNLV